MEVAVSLIQALVCGSYSLVLNMFAGKHVSQSSTPYFWVLIPEFAPSVAVVYYLHYTAKPLKSMSFQRLSD